jgi:hypothetical protein
MKRNYYEIAAHSLCDRFPIAASRYEMIAQQSLQIWMDNRCVAALQSPHSRCAVVWELPRNTSQKSPELLRNCCAIEALLLGCRSAVEAQSKRKQGANAAHSLPDRRQSQHNRSIIAVQYLALSVAHFLP